MKNNMYKGYLEWKNWGESFGVISNCTRRYYDLELKKIETNLKEKYIRVLEVGFGNGSFLSYALEKGWDIYGLEVNPDLIKTAKLHGFQVHDCIDAFDNSFFDLIIAFDVLEHIDSNEIIEFMDKVKNKLNTGGFFLARFPNGDSPMGMKNQNGDMTHKSIIGTEKILQIAKICNLRVYSISGEKDLIIMETLKKTLHRICVFPIKKMIDLFFKIIYFPTALYFFSSQNLVVTLKNEE